MAPPKSISGSTLVYCRFNDLQKAQFVRLHFSLDNLRYSFICQFKITTKITTNVVIYCAVPGVGGHKVIKPSPRTALTIFRNMHRHDTFALGPSLAMHDHVHGLL